MDIYQIWTTYNKQWSRYEILAFVGVMILVCTVMAVCVHRKKLKIIQATAVLALVVFLGIVLDVIKREFVELHIVIARRSFASGNRKS